jgi:hypothetical protein
VLVVVVAVQRVAVIVVHVVDVVVVRHGDVAAARSMCMGGVAVSRTGANWVVPLGVVVGVEAEDGEVGGALAGALDDQGCRGCCSR